MEARSVSNTEELIAAVRSSVTEDRSSLIHVPLAPGILTPPNA
jgi:hypothetical protein